VSAARLGAIYRVTVEVAPAVEAEWARWQASGHMPEVASQPGFVGATLWRDSESAPDGWVRYVVHYEAESAAAIEAYRRSEAAARLRGDHEKHYGAVTRIVRTVLSAPVSAARRG
jgi:heme-degrading monooxygenase HmoA